MTNNQPGTVPGNPAGGAPSHRQDAMTSAQRKLLGAVALVGIVFTIGGGCASDGPRLVPPTRLTTPYDTSRRDVVWAVAPPRNESGTSAVNPRAVGDALVSATSEVNGLTALSLNRSIRAMRALGLDEVTGPAEAQQLASVLGADAVLIASITDWDPYDPPVIGLSAALIPAPGRLEATGGASIDDTRLFQLQATEDAIRPGARDAGAAHSSTAQHISGRDHETLMAVRRYAEGRLDPDDPLGWQAYLKSMPLYTTFSAHRVVGSLLDQEWLRLARARNAANR